MAAGVKSSICEPAALDPTVTDAANGRSLNTAVALTVTVTPWPVARNRVYSAFLTGFVVLPSSNAAPVRVRAADRDDGATYPAAPETSVVVRSART